MQKPLLSKLTLGAIAVFAVVLGATAAAPMEPAPAAQIDIAKVSCGDLKAASPLDRSAIVMFYWGYEAAKAGATTFKTGLLKTATDALMKECSASSSETVTSAMQRINVKMF